MIWSLSPVIFVVGALIVLNMIGASISVSSMVMGSILTLGFMAFDRLAINHHRQRNGGK